MLFGRHQQSPKPNQGKNSMYSTIVDNSPLIQVAAGKHSAIYALDGSQMNPLEAFYAVLAACAAVYAKKACKELAVPAEGIEINCKPFAGRQGLCLSPSSGRKSAFPSVSRLSKKSGFLRLSHTARSRRLSKMVRASSSPSSRFKHSHRHHRLSSPC